MDARVHCSSHLRGRGTFSERRALHVCGAARRVHGSGGATWQPRRRRRLERTRPAATEQQEGSNNNSGGRNHGARRLAKRLETRQRKLGTGGAPVGPIDRRDGAVYMRRRRRAYPLSDRAPCVCVRAPACVFGCVCVCVCRSVSVVVW